LTEIERHPVGVIFVNVTWLVNILFGFLPIVEVVRKVSSPFKDIRINYEAVLSMNDLCNYRSFILPPLKVDLHNDDEKSTSSNSVIRYAEVNDSEGESIRLNALEDELYELKRKQAQEEQTMKKTKRKFGIDDDNIFADKNSLLHTNWKKSLFLNSKEEVDIISNLGRNENCSNYSDEKSFNRNGSAIGIKLFCNYSNDNTSEEDVTISRKKFENRKQSIKKQSLLVEDSQIVIYTDTPLAKK